MDNEQRHVFVENNQVIRCEDVGYGIIRRNAEPQTEENLVRAIRWLQQPKFDELRRKARELRHG